MARIINLKMVIILGLAAAVAALAACSRDVTSSTAPLASPVSFSTTYTVTVLGDTDSTAAYMFSLRSTFVNLWGSTVYMHRLCDDDSFGADTLPFEPWVGLRRVNGDATPIAYPVGGCALSQGTPAPPLALAPGDSISTDFLIERLSVHRGSTAADTAALTGLMSLYYIVASTAGPLSDPKTKLLPVEFRSSAPFQVVLP